MQNINEQNENDVSDKNNIIL